MRRLDNIFRLGIKELYSLRRDFVMLALIVWAFSLSVYTAATGMSHELHNAAVAIVDQDRSQLSMRIRQALMPPYFREPTTIAFDRIDPGMDSRRYTFVLVIPPRFQADILAGRQAEIQVNIDATAMMQAGIGDGYIANIVRQEIATFIGAGDARAGTAARLTTRFAFNPNLTSAWFTSIMQIIQQVTMLSVILAGAALVREREHGTIEHLLVMPVSPFEIMMAKLWANALVITLATALSLWLVVEISLGVPIAGSRVLFLAGTVVYLFFSTALGIFLGTLARTMPQFGLLFMLIVLPMNMLSGGQTPIESQPDWLNRLTLTFASRHYVSFAQAILYRGAGLDVVWPQFATVAAIGAAFFLAALARFRQSIALTR